ncbi:hypothetical protein ES705_37973 [subsurface metagenome]
MITLDYNFLKAKYDRKRPFVPLNIINPHANNLSQKIFCLLDTGADDCLFNIETVNSLEHDLKAEGVEPKSKTGISGNSVPVWPHTFILQLLHPNGTDVVWESDQILIDCHESYNVPNILGTDNFLKEFTITFDYQNEIATMIW